MRIDNRNPGVLNQANEKAHSDPDLGGVRLFTPRHSRSPRRSRKVSGFQARKKTPKEAPQTQKITPLKDHF
jgi:hypothetical protein